MATVFRAYGFQVVHDTTLCDYPAYNGAYDRSYAVVEQWLAKYPSIQVVLDVHRDALVGSGGGDIQDGDHRSGAEGGPGDDGAGH